MVHKRASKWDFAPVCVWWCWVRFRHHSYLSRCGQQYSTDTPMVCSHMLYIYKANGAEWFKKYTYWEKAARNIHTRTPQIRNYIFQLCVNVEGKQYIFAIPKKQCTFIRYIPQCLKKKKKEKIHRIHSTGAETKTLEITFCFWWMNRKLKQFPALGVWVKKRKGRENGRSPYRSKFNFSITHASQFLSKP